jgi:serine phosphatase RsbU (regulator of sigma subunit)
LPYPILIRPGCEPRQIVSEGGLVGAFDGQEYPVVSHEMHGGDTLLFYTDGLEALLAGSRASSPGADIITSSWLKRLVEAGPEAGLAEIRERAAGLSEMDWRKDDVTVLAITMQ